MSELPALETSYELTEEQIEQYQVDGHILLRQVCTKEEVETFRPHIGAAVTEHAKKQKALAERDTYGKAFLQIGNIWTRDEAVKRFVFAKRFAGIAAQLTKSKAVRLYHDQALYKEGHGGITPWHQDQYYWPLDTNQSITMWMPLVDVSREMGSMGFASGSHRKGYLGEIPISDESDEHFKNYVRSQGYEVVQSGKMQAGDASFHNGWTLHGADPNQTDTTREVMTIIYYPDGTFLIEPDHEHRQNDFNSFYPGMKPGVLAASELTPVLYGENGG